MEPIISPWLIYFLGVIGVVKSDTISAFIGFFVVAGLITFIIGACNQKYMEVTYSEETLKDDDEYKFSLVAKKIGKTALIPSLIFAIFLIFLPSKNTIIGMIAAKNITRDNIASVISAGKSVKDEIKSDIADIIRMIANGGEEDEEE